MAFHAPVLLPVKDSAGELYFVYLLRAQSFVFVFSFPYCLFVGPSGFTFYSFSPSSGAQVALATVLLNYAIAVTRFHSKLGDVEEAVGQIVTCVDLLLLSAIDAECVFRGLCAVGTLLQPPASSSAAIGKHAAAFVRGCELPVFLNRILVNQSGLPETPPKVSEVAQFVDRILN